MKNHKVLTTILIIFLILLVIFIVHTVRNYIILDKLFTKELSLLDKSNLSLSRKLYNENTPDKTSTMDIFVKDNKSMMVLKRPYETIKTIIVWDDNQASEQLTMLPETLIAYRGNAATFLNLPTLVESKEFNYFGYKLFLAMTSFITTDKVNDEDCYCIRLSYLTQFDKNKSWVNKDTGIIVKQTNGFTEIDGKLYSQFSEITSYSFDTVTDEMVAKPNLAGYLVIN